jgi:hypothetical protein
MYRILTDMNFNGRSQWPRGLKRGSTAARLLGSWDRNPPGAWMFVLCYKVVWNISDMKDETI